MKTLCILCISAIVISSCNKKDVETETPKCVEEAIIRLDKSSPCDDEKVEAYTFQGNTVYTFSQGTCGADLSTEVMSSDCTSLGFIGGFDGNTTINGEKFSNAIFIKIIWEK